MSLSTKQSLAFPVIYIGKEREAIWNKDHLEK